MLYLCTQQSNIDDKGKKNVDEQREAAAGCTDDEEEEIAEGCSDDEQQQIAEDREESSDDDQDGDFMEEDEVETESDEESELNEKLIDLKKRKRAGSKQLCEDEEAEDIFCDSDNSDDSDCEVLQETVAVTKKKLPVRKGPTTRSHCSQQSTTPADWLPSDDEGQDGDLDPEDDDGFETMSWALPKGRKSRAKKMDPRVWYDESRLHPEQGLCMKMCFQDVYQFRRALQTLHIAQLRNFRYHRNCKDRVMAVCSTEGCPFYMIGSVIKNEKTFCLRKCHLEHTCGTSGEHCKVTGKWVA
jgi:hypothetical protein